MPAYKTNGTVISYITSIGFRESRIISIAEINNRVYYRLENGDYVEETPLGFVKAYENEKLLREFGKLYCGTTGQ